MAAEKDPRAKSLSMSVFWRRGALVVSGWYLLEVALHYFMQRPLWIDEMCVFYSIERYTSVELFSRTLLADQTFPRCYVWLIKWFSGLFDHSVLSLRFFPLVAMVSGFFVWSAVARREIKRDRLFFLFQFSWAASIMLVYYAAELKPYSFDVLATGLVFLFLQRQQELSRGQYAVITCLVPFLGLFSYAPFFLLIFLARDLWRRVRRDRGLWPVLPVCGALWLGILACVYWVDMRFSPPGLAAVFADHFISIRSPEAFFQSFGQGMNNFVSRWFASKPLWIRSATRVFFVFAVIEMLLCSSRKFRRDGEGYSVVAAIAPFLLLELLVLSALNIFPFRLPRAVLFFGPVLFYLLIRNFGRMERKWPVVSRSLQGAYGFFLFVVAVGITQAAVGGNLGMELTLWMR